MKLKLTSLFVLILIIFGCSTDFDVIAPYKEIMIIDGFLDAHDTVQYVKVGKAFLGEGNAYVMAKQSDSINYADVLDVKLQRILNKVVLSTTSLTRLELYDKDTGVFASPFHVLYKTNQSILQDGSEYKVIVTNNQTGVVASSNTKIVRDMTVGYPVRDSVELAVPFEQKVLVRFTPGLNSNIFDFHLIFHFREIDPSGNSKPDSIIWDFIDKTLSNNQDIIFEFYKQDLFVFMNANIPVLPAGYIRRIDSLRPGIRPFEFKLMEGSEDLRTYLELQQPSTGIVQDRPTFTTVENGLGIFTSRIIHPVYCDPESETKHAIDTSAYTRNLGFVF